MCTSLISPPCFPLSFSSIGQEADRIAWIHNKGPKPVTLEELWAARDASKQLWQGKEDMLRWGAKPTLFEV